MADITEEKPDDEAPGCYGSNMTGTLMYAATVFAVVAAALRVSAKVVIPMAK